MDCTLSLRGAGLSPGLALPSQASATGEGLAGCFVLLHYRWVAGLDQDLLPAKGAVISGLLPPAAWQLPNAHLAPPERLIAASLPSRSG